MEIEDKRVPKQLHEVGKIYDDHGLLYMVVDLQDGFGFVNMETGYATCTYEDMEELDSCNTDDVLVNAKLVIE